MFYYYFVRFDEKENYVELDYPRDISMFAGIGTNIDAAFQWKNGKLSLKKKYIYIHIKYIELTCKLFAGTTYFFKGKHFWQFDDMRMRVAHKRPKPSAQYWMHCPRGIETNDVNFDFPTKSRIHSISASATIAMSSRLVVAIATILLILSFRRTYA